MRCPFCGNIDTQVKDSRPAEDHVSIRRRRFCPACGGRFTTYERVQLRDLVVIKSNGKREDFDRDKLERSIRISMQKRPIDPERIDQMISGIVRRLESMGETDIPSKTIGEIVMEALQRIDTVAYVRFASVYKNFQAADDFDKFVQELRPDIPSEEGAEPPIPDLCVWPSVWAGAGRAKLRPTRLWGALSCATGVSSGVDGPNRVGDPMPRLRPCLRRAMPRAVQQPMSPLNHVPIMARRRPVRMR